MSWSWEGGEGNRCGSCGEWEVPLGGQRVQTPLRGPTACFRLDYLASRSLSFLVCSWGDGSVD